MPDVLNLFRWLKRRWKGKPCSFKINTDIFADKTSGEVFMEILKKETKPKDGAGGYFPFAAVKEEPDYVFEVHLFNRTIGVDGKENEEHIGKIYMYRGDNLTEQQREEEFVSFTRVPWIKEINFVHANVKLHVYFTFDNKVLNENSMSHSEAWQDIRDIAFKTKPEEFADEFAKVLDEAKQKIDEALKPVKEEIEKSEREKIKVKVPLSVNVDEIRKPKWWRDGHGIAADNEYVQYMANDLSMCVRMVTTKEDGTNDFHNEVVQAGELPLFRDSIYVNAFKSYWKQVMFNLKLLPNYIRAGYEVLYDTFDIDTNALVRNKWRCVAHNCKRGVMHSYAFECSLTKWQTVCLCDMHFSKIAYQLAEQWREIVERLEVSDSEEETLETVTETQVETKEAFADSVWRFFVEGGPEDAWRWVGRKGKKFFGSMKARVEQVDLDDVVTWLLMMTATGVVSYGIGRACDKVCSPKKKNMDLFEEEKVRAKHKFWAIYGDANGKYRQYDEVTLLGDDGKPAGKMSWGDFKNYFNSSRGAQELSDHFADGNGEVRFQVKGREGTGKLKMRNLNYVFEAVRKPDYDFDKLSIPRREVDQWRKNNRSERDAKKQKILNTLERIHEVQLTRKICGTCGIAHRGKCLAKNIIKAEVELVADEGVMRHPLKMLEEVYEQEKVLGGVQMINLEDVDCRVGKVLVDGNFTETCYLHGNKVVVLTHGVTVDKKVVENRRIQFEFPDTTILPIGEIKTLEKNEDFSYYTVQPSKAHKRINLREPKMGEKVCLIAYKDGLNKMPSLSFGVASPGGQHTCSSEYGCCSGPLMSCETKEIVGFHCAGGAYVNRAFMVDSAVKKHLNC
nr:polyprotein [Patatavirales sp.]